MDRGFPGKSWVEVDLGAIAHNVHAIHQWVKAGVKIMAIVKSDAYGHGAHEVSHTLARTGVEMFGVATLEEGIALRQGGIMQPILVLGCIFPEEAEDLIRYSLIPNLCDRWLAQELSRRARVLDKEVRVHIKVDTGMGGLGVRHEVAVKFVKEVSSLEGLFVEGIFTHFSSSCERDKGSVYEQLCIFRGILEELDGLGIDIPLRHAANSGAILEVPEAHFNMVRPGLLLYGLYPAEDVRRSVELRPAMMLKSRLAFLKELEPGQTVSYGRTYKAQRPTRVGVLPLGYDNGYSLGLSNKAEVVVRGQRLPVIGRVRMNHVHIDLTELPTARVGDEVVLYGRQKGECVSVEEVSRLAGTIPYDVVCATGKANPRVYLNGAN